MESWKRAESFDFLGISLTFSFFVEVGDFQARRVDVVYAIVSVPEITTLGVCREHKNDRDFQYMHASVMKHLST